MRGKIKYLIIAFALVLAALTPSKKAEALICPALHIIFARGSGGEINTDQNYLAYKATIEEKLKTTKLNYKFTDLDYPAVGVGIDNLGVTMGAYFGAGEAYEFGESVNTGVQNLTNLVNNQCPNTKYVIGGYSQGAMVISKALRVLNIDKVIYAATFGDPKIYLPEGEGLIPAACRGKNLSDYRMYVPDCRAYLGLLGAYIPYRPESWIGKVGTWCNKRDIFCSSKASISDHIAYVSENLYEDASRVIFDKIMKCFGLENHISSPHDTAILIDSTGSMGDLIDKYKDEALRLAKETLAAGGRVALYDYRDLSDPYAPKKHCDFENCTLEIIQDELNKIQVDGGGDNLESLLSASFHVMKELNWKLGSTKSLVVLTDDGFLMPDRDGMTIDDVIKLSKEIDPVNFYIITKPAHEGDYTELAEATDGKVVTDLNELSLLTDYILERYDSLPKVEETVDIMALPEISITGTEWLSDTEVKIGFKNSGSQALVILNDKILGTTSGTSVTIGGLDHGVENIITLVPINDDSRGNGVNITLESQGNINISVPKAPDTGRL
ncbi:cutinase family protein [Candidatus Saccharibacteria bacterium]|nr:cutinase family protein [Candidatus Saccharibacteria bacterium]